MTGIPAGFSAIDPAGFNTQKIDPIANQQPGFVDALKQTLQQAQQIQSEADRQVSALAAGKAVDVQATMIAVEKASLSFELAMEVRNKIVQAYRDVYNMQF
ncbi:MAG TPA: flagellar hook-basal body complex protein FliE [Terriglobia bacterium]|jgi:flagellar hook-basal body complex protein FliE|nr:flagellar hook-basal body complex protein FliE [Terriglobia bacterium]